MDIINIMPIGMGLFKHTGITNDQKKFIKNLVRKKNKGNNYTKNSFVLNAPELADLKEFVQHSLNEYFINIVNPKHDVKPVITQSWVNYSNQGDYHHRHNHPNSYLSGVYYLDVDDTDSIVFTRPAPSSLNIQPKTHNLYNSDSVWIPAKKDHLIVFPSWLEHEVETLNKSHTRISLAFNSFVSGQLADTDSMQYLTVSYHE